MLAAIVVEGPAASLLDWVGGGLLMVLLTGSDFCVSLELVLTKFAYKTSQFATSINVALIHKPFVHLPPYN